MNKILHTHTYTSGQQLELVQGDITQEKVDAIVNAANAQLRHGGGVAAIISSKGGVQINTQSKAWVEEHGPVSHDTPAYTTGGDLPCRYVIHVVGPVWGSGEEEVKLASAVGGSLALAARLGLASIAFPAISTGIFGFPKDLAATVMVHAVNDYFERNPGSGLSQVRITLYDKPTTDAFIQVWEELLGSEN
jgi:O-acetyl-ADP-ribose deacetylase (regulator of RNase III)